jgi:hypothetical protein
MRFLRWLFDIESGSRIEHPVLGEAVYFKAKFGSYWEIETELAGRPFTLIVDSEDRAEPTEAQVAFFQRYAAEPSLAFAKAAPVLMPEYERWTKQKFPSEWLRELAFVGMSVPLSGDEQLKYELSFEGLRRGALAHFVCTVEQGVATSVEVST